MRRIAPGKGNPDPLAADFREGFSSAAVGEVVSDLLKFRPGGNSGLVICSITQNDNAPNSPSCPSPSPSPESVAVAKNQRRAWLQGLSRVTGFKVYRRDIVPVRQAWAANPPTDPGERGEIYELSTKSQRKLALYASNSPVEFASMVTVTYPMDFPADGKLVKKHLNALLCVIRARFPGFQYLWVLEFQRRGAPHFHIFTDIELPAPLRPMKRSCGRTNKTVRVNWELHDWLGDRWFDIVGSDDEKHRLVGAAWEVLEKRDGCARYIAKEAYKTFQKVVPEDFRNVGRFWGCSKGVPPEEPETIPANKGELAAFLPSESFGAEGEPFPIVFGAADSYRKILGTRLDPAKVRAWKSGTPDKHLLSEITLHGVKSIRPKQDHED